MEAADVKELNAHLQQGSITLQMYAEGLAAIKTQKQRERSTPAPALHDVVYTILGEPISEEVKRRLLKPLLPRNPRPVPPPRPSKRRKRKAIVEEFDPLSIALRTTADYQQEILDLFDVASNKKKLAFRQTPWAIGSFLRGWQMDAPERYGADPRASLEKMRPRSLKKLEEEIRARNGIKFQFVLKVQLRKTEPDGKEKYTDPVLRHKQDGPSPGQ